jgi:hypothetical protein
MMKVKLRMMRLAISTTMILMLLLVSGCGKSLQQKLVGTWQDHENNIVEFFEDGSLNINLSKPESNGIKELSGKWLILQDGRVKLEFSILGIISTQVYDIKVNGKEMIWASDKDKKGTKYYKLK